MDDAADGVPAVHLQHPILLQCVPAAITIPEHEGTQPGMVRCVTEAAPQADTPWAGSAAARGSAPRF